MRNLNSFTNLGEKLVNESLLTMKALIELIVLLKISTIYSHRLSFLNKFDKFAILPNIFIFCEVAMNHIL